MTILLVAAPAGAADRSPKVHPALRELLAGGERPVKAWVFFTDKAVRPGPERDIALTRLEREYDARAVDRRARRRTLPGLLDEHDLPVSPSYIDQVTAAGARLHVTSRWLNAISVWITRAHLDAIASMPFVGAIEPVRRGVPIETEPAGIAPPGGAAGGNFYGLSEPQLDQIGLLELHASGATGEGIVIGVLDTGFKRTHMAFTLPDHPLQVVAEYDFINNDGNAGIDEGDPPNQHSHGTLILGVMGAYLPGLVVGAAYDASFILCKTEDITDEYQGEEDNYVAGLEFIEANGGDVATSSLGYIDWYTQGDLDGQTAVTTIAVNIATANGLMCCTAAGNGGHDDDPLTSHLLAPADALQVITCGAADLNGEIAGFSSDGPTADGRLKPEVLARGVDTITVSASDDAALTDPNGTSLSTPLVAGAVACLVQARPDWTVDQMRQFLFETAGYFQANGAPDPLFVQGYGFIDAFAAAEADCNGNGIADDAELAGGGPDTNNNGRLDGCDADLNGDLEVGVPDLIQLILAWGPCPNGCDEDLNGDGEVGVEDLIFLIVNWAD